MENYCVLFKQLSIKHKKTYEKIIKHYNDGGLLLNAADRMQQ